MKEACIRLIQAHQIFPSDVLLVADAALGDSLEQYVHRRLQIDDEIGLGRFDRELCAHLIVERELFFIQRDAREQAILLEKIIRNAHGREEILLFERGELLRPLKQEIQLRREGSGARIAVEALEERILRSLLEDDVRRQTGSEAPRKTRLADADGSLNHDEL